MRFLVDAQLPPALARFLTAQGHDAAHVLDCNMLEATDLDIWAYSIANDAVIVTKDEDFALMSAKSDETRPRIVWIRIGNCSKQELLAWFERRSSEIVALLQEGNALVEVR